MDQCTFRGRSPCRGYIKFRDRLGDTPFLKVCDFHWKEYTDTIIGYEHNE